LAAVTPRRVIGLLVLLAALAVYKLQPPPLTPETAPAAALVVFTIGFWASGIVAEQLVALAFFLLAMVLGAAPASVVFSGFGAGAFWVVFGGLVIGAAVERTGLGGRLARRIVGALSRSYTAVIVGLVAVSLVLIMLMPSTMGRIVMLMPIVMSLADRLGFEEGSRGRNGIVPAMVWSSYLSSTAVLPANVPNNVLVGAAESLYGVHIRYFDYFAMHYPVLGLVKAVVVAVVCILMFREPPRPVAASAGGGGSSYLTRDEKRLSLLLAVALVLWSTDALHGVSPAWVSLGAAVVLMLPGVGLVPPETFRDKVTMGPLLYVAGILGVGALVAHSGLGGLISRAMLDAVHLDPAAPFKSFMAISGVSMILGMFSTMPGVPAIMAPVVGDMAEVAGLPVTSVLPMIVVGFATVWFPYQVPPVIVGLQIARVPLLEAFKVSSVTAVISVVLLFPLDWLWLRLIGVLP
jgi:di/tricarboxylate transporter